MESKIIFLGTGGDSTVISQQVRGSGGIIIMIDGFQFHIDPGPGALIRSRQFNVNPRHNTALISTRNHINHAGGLNEIIYAMTHDGLDKKGVIIGSNNVINSDDDNDPFLNKKYREYVERFIALKENQKVGINTVEIKAIKSFNKDPSSFGLKFITPKYTISYSSDTEYREELLEEYKDSNILILNTVFPFETKKSKYLNMNDTVKILNKIKPKLCILSHFGMRMLKADPLHESREVQKQTNVEVIVAKDGMVVSPTNYSTNLIQKTLNVYPASKKEE